MRLPYCSSCFGFRFGQCCNDIHHLTIPREILADIGAIFVQGLQVTCTPIAIACKYCETPSDTTTPYNRAPDLTITKTAFSTLHAKITIGYSIWQFENTRFPASNTDASWGLYLRSAWERTARCISASADLTWPKMRPHI